MPDVFYCKVDFNKSSREIGIGVINAMRQFFLNNVTDLDYLIEYRTAIWSQGNSTRTGYFDYEGAEVQWTVVKGTAAANNYRDLNHISTIKCIEESWASNYEIRAYFRDEPGVAMRLRTTNSDVYSSMKRTIGILE